MNNHMDENDTQVNLSVDDNGYPEYCYTVLKSIDDQVVLLQPYQKGYNPTRKGNQPWYGQETADGLNQQIGVTKSQVEAMKFGSMFGWDLPGAQIKNYNEKGEYKNKNSLTQS